MTLILRRLLASSTFAISGTLDGLAKRLQGAADQVQPVEAAPLAVAENFETVDELIDEWEDDAEGEDDGATAGPRFTDADMPGMQAEIAHLREFAALAKSIVRNSKGECVIGALEKGFAKARHPERVCGRRVAGRFSG